jgi:hypothetical protein
MKAGEHRAADLLHGRQALSHLTQGPTWRRATLSYGVRFVKELPEPPRDILDH